VPALIVKETKSELPPVLTQVKLATKELPIAVSVLTSYKAGIILAVDPTEEITVVEPAAGIVTE
jgi:hypothetical protein